MANISDIMTYNITELDDPESAALLNEIRQSLMIHQEMFNRIINGNAISPTFVDFFEDLGNVYLNYSEQLAQRLSRTRSYVE